MTTTVNQANVGASSDITQAEAENNDFYGIMAITRTPVEILDLAQGVEALRKIYVALSNDAAVKAAPTTDIASQIKARAYDRTTVLYSSKTAEYMDAALLGLQLPKQAGATNWALKTLAGITAETLTGTEVVNLDGKYATYYVEIGGVNVTINTGVKVGSGEWIDVIRGRDWIQANMEEEVFTLLLTVDKISYTDGGIAQVGNPIKKVLEEALSLNILAVSDTYPAGYTLTLPVSADISAAQKQTRNLTGITFVGNLAGAVNKAEIRGTLVQS